MRVVRLAAILGLAACGCASGQRVADAPHLPPKDGPETEVGLPIPADLAAKVAESARLGRLIYLLDKAGATGTDVLRAKVPDWKSRGLGGWLAIEEPAAGAPPGCSVVFYTDETMPRLMFEVTVPATGEPSVAEASPPVPLEGDLFRMARARLVALAVVAGGGRRFNPVVFPLRTPGNPNAILVYLLAPEYKADEMVFGVHYRVLVSADGTSAGNKVEQVVPLTKSALVVSVAPRTDVPRDAKFVATVVSHIVTDYPLETHVFVSLLHKNAPIYVTTNRGTWLVMGDQIKLVDDKLPYPRP
jgi:hypothetical protein